MANPFQKQIFFIRIFWIGKGILTLIYRFWLVTDQKRAEVLIENSDEVLYASRDDEKNDGKIERPSLKFHGFYVDALSLARKKVTREEALKKCEKALKLYKDHSENGDFWGSETVYLEVLENKGNILITLGKEWREEHRYIQARNCFKELLVKTEEFENVDRFKANAHWGIAITLLRHAQIDAMGDGIHGEIDFSNNDQREAVIEAITNLDEAINYYGNAMKLTKAQCQTMRDELKKLLSNETDGINN